MIGVTVHMATRQHAHLDHSKQRLQVQPVSFAVHPGLYDVTGHV